ncbi:hypothetical protein PF005_g19504 [Phytophthora fragariae]|uniref:Uncharacterized protein n=1 Tax=Phytophthora fragariae TaxID=53985 RepID=A0A6A3SMT2_9STRA|nr:hypothetical protein PF003_g234 [Phytophthora fragariae]KAE8931704.1 hypothetical protein PF009_g18242 [Phytophthora fragariae]KAE8990356.1 hypothetical protein PF011_g18397 [Phytophthora fragariae]KAE9094094.1 hypothetical protein PF007_g17884 [Phytophthora fragariae]KAE9119219.1 hypothetical protein PF006_g18400 [Phytophthora fragariae]
MYADADAESNVTVQRHGADTAALVSEYKGKLVPAIVEAVRVAARDPQAVAASRQLRPLGRVVSACKPVGQRGGGGTGRQRHARARGPRAAREVC